MFGDNPFAVPISSFQRPVPLVLIDPDDEPNYNVCFRVEWLPYILGSLQQLLLQTTWKTSDPDELQLQQNMVRNLIALFMMGCPSSTATMPVIDGCASFPPDSPIITYAPQNPFTQPDYIPPGYIAVPFLEVTAGSLLSFFPGAQVGDVISGYLSLPILTPAIGEGLARFRVHLSGAGVCELHLIRFPGAGAVLITTDDDPLTVRTINLNKDIIQLPAETIGEVVVEVPITHLGEHHIDVTFVPRFDDTAIFLSYGGGIRSVSLCGFDKTVDELVDERARRGGISVDENEEQMLRVDPDRCWIIQRECSPGEWVDFFDARCGTPGAIEQPTNGADLLPGQCREWDVVLRGSDRWLMPVAINTNDVVEVTGASGAWSDGTTAWNCVNGDSFVLGACTSVGAGTSGTDPLPVQNHMRLVQNMDGTWFDGLGVHAVPSGVTDGQLWFQANDDSLSDNSGTVSFHVKICRQENVVTPISITYPFGLGIGPSEVNSGDIFNVTAVDNGGGGHNWYVDMEFSREVKVTVLSVGSYVLSGAFGSGTTYGQIKNTAGTVLQSLVVGTNVSPIEYTPQENVKHFDCGAGNAVWTITVKVEDF